ncbi:TniQ family protein [Undibacterium arcticum]|uniref:TniQ family protein n=1 Tax=Undibacterium arcticum TaxID=1762892 RepID=UPI003613ECB2
MNLDRVVCTSLPIVAHPVDDEGLRSWIGRVAACYSVPAQTLLKHTGIGRTNICVGNWLTLSGLHVSDILILAKTLRRSTSALTGMVTTPWCLPENAEFGMCAQCVMETFRSGRPMYWRRRWLDAVTVGCLKHVTWLTPIDANIFRKSVNWHGVEQHLLAIAENEASKQSCRTPSRLADCINMSALHLQSLFADDPDDRTAWLRYGIVSASGARRVAQDLLDILLAAEASRPDYSLLSEFASRLKIPIALHTVSIIPRQARAMRIRQVKHWRRAFLRWR